MKHKCDHIWKLVLIRSYIDEFMCKVNKYYLYCPKCGRQKKNLPEWKARLFTNISEQQQEYKRKYNEKI